MKPPPPDHGLVGIWVTADPTSSDVHHSVAIRRGRYSVAAHSEHDGEAAQVFDVSWDGTSLRYALHWPSTGRFTRNVLTTLDDNTAELTFTFTDQVVMLRAPKPKNPSKRVRLRVVR